MLCLEIDDPENSRYWKLPGFSQTFHFWKQNKRASCRPLHASITYVSLPWNYIIADLINCKRQPILTF